MGYSVGAPSSWLWIVIYQELLSVMCSQTELCKMDIVCTKILWTVCIHIFWQFAKNPSLWLITAKVTYIIHPDSALNQYNGPYSNWPCTKAVYSTLWTSCQFIKVTLNLVIFEMLHNVHSRACMIVRHAGNNWIGSILINAWHFTFTFT